MALNVFGSMPANIADAWGVAVTVADEDVIADEDALVEATELKPDQPKHFGINASQ